MHDDTEVFEALTEAGLPFYPCGLGADWCVSAWYFGPGKANCNTEPALYLLDTEEGDEEEGYYEVVTLVDATVDSEERDIRSVASGSLADCVAYLRAEFGLNR